MNMPTIAELESVLGEFTEHKNHEHEADQPCEFCQITHHLDSMPCETGQLSPFDSHLSKIISQLGCGELLVVSGTTREIIDLCRFSLVIGIKLGRRQVVDENLGNLKA